MTWNQEGVTAQLTHFDDASPWTQNTSMHPMVEAYLRFYHLDFVEQNLAHEHIMGWRDIGEHRIITHLWRIEGATQTAVIIHGYYDHTGLYDKLIAFCLQRGMNVLMWDQPGHGLSSGEPAHIDSFQTYDNVLAHQVTSMKQRMPKQQLCVMGQSTGGAVIINYLLKRELNDHNSPFARAILMAPLVLPKGWAQGRWMLPLAKMLSVKRLKRNFSPSSSDAEFLPFVQHQDPLQAKHLYTSWVNALSVWYSYICQRPTCEHTLYCVQGDNDNTVDWQYNMPFLRDKFINVDISILANAQHHLVNESERLRASLFTTIATWLDG